MADDNTTVHPVADDQRARAGAQPVLEVTAGESKGQRFALQPVQLVGKGGGAEIELSDPGVSRKHAKIMVTRDGGVTVMDLASTNGTFINETAIEVAPLRANDRIRLGPQAELRLDFVPRQPGESPAASLSPRQLEVASLVAQGLTNAEVAERLAVRVRTVTSHLDHIYARLGIRSRSALTRLMLESGRTDDR